MKRIMLLAVLLSAMSSCTPGEPTDEEDLVNDWLRTNTDTGKWEEIKWWKTVESKASDRKGATLLRLKYRSADVLHDKIFIMQGGKVVTAQNWNGIVGIENGKKVWHQPNAGDAAWYAANFPDLYSLSDNEIDSVMLRNMSYEDNIKYFTKRNDTKAVKALQEEQELMGDR